MKFAALALLVASVSATAQEIEKVADIKSCKEAKCDEKECCGTMTVTAKDGKDADDADIKTTEKMCALKATKTITFTGFTDDDDKLIASAFACDAAADGSAALKTSLAGAALALTYYMA